MEISLHYGDGRVVVDIPQDNVADVIRPRTTDAARLSNAEMIKQIMGKAASEFSDSIRGRTVGVLLSDGTRDVLLEAILPPIFPLLKNAQQVLFFICTGTHTADTPENKAIIELIRSEAAKAQIESYDIVLHDCRQAEFISAGTARRGTEVLYNARLRDADAFLVLSDVKHHYFAGYSNPIKNFMPGLCAFRTAEQNHSWTVDERSCAGVHPWHLAPALRDNPLAQDQLEAMNAIVKDRPVRALVTLSSEGRIQWADFGVARDVTSQAFLRADEWNCFAVEPVAKMVVSPGGLPNDVDLYIAQRALELTAEAVCDGGEILFLAACPKGIGSPRTTAQFYDKLVCPLDEIHAAAREDYSLYSHKPRRFARLVRRLNRLRLYSEVDADEIEKMHMTPCSDPQAVINGWLRQNPEEKILAVDGANKLLLRHRS